MVLEQDSECVVTMFLAVGQYEVDRIEVKVLDDVLDCFEALSINEYTITHHTLGENVPNCQAITTKHQQKVSK